MMLKINKISVEIENFYQLKLSCSAEGENLKYAYYVYRNDELVEKFLYTHQSNFLYNLDQEGNYKVRVFVRDVDKTITKYTKDIYFSGFVNSTTKQNKSDILLFGVSKTSMMMKKILEKRYNVLCYLEDDPSKIGKTFFDLPIRDIRDYRKSNIEIVVDEFHDPHTFKDANKYDFFSYDLHPSNIVTKTMYQLKALELYKISRFCYLNGFVEGADYIRDFIQFKFNSFIPYTAEIGEGTRFGYGGVGLIIHKKAKIGKNCVISQNVTIGSRGPLPIIGDHVFVAPGAKCIGGTIGNNVVIGANSVVTKDIPSNCVVAGVPAKVISTDMSKYNRYFK
ncbi:serine acetyltransferase [Rossellomorea sp. AcN35-11]|nr:serine acetyltransferase [Rossellomorea aquimaris]WJV30762.1 serine acetyltransferase [Rossellomorea sp. AcN35-11]